MTRQMFNGELTIRNTHIFIVGFVFPWKRYDVMRDRFTISFGLGYWFGTWASNPKARTDLDYDHTTHEY